MIDVDDSNSFNKSVKELHGVKIYLNKLMKNMTEVTLRDIENNFLEKGVKGKLRESQLQGVLKLYDIILTEKDFKPLFNKIDVRKKGTVNFLQFMVYLSFEFEHTRTQNILSETKPINLSIKLLPDKMTQKNKKSKFDIKSMVFVPQINEQGKLITDESDYVAITEKGQIIFYSTDLKWKDSHSIQESTEVILLRIILFINTFLKFYTGSF